MRYREIAFEIVVAEGALNQLLIWFDLTTATIATTFHESFH